MRPYIQVKNLQKKYRLTPNQKRELGLQRRKALQGLSFNVQRGECFGLLGPYGAGKTTAMQAIVNRLPMSGGRIYIDGQRVNNGYRPNAELITAEWTVADFYCAQVTFDLCAKARNIEEREVVRRRDMILRRFGLSDVDQELVRDLSPVQKKRLSLVMGMTREADIIIYDEPAEPLDGETYKLVLDYLQEMKAKGKTIILSVQWDVRLIEKMCDRVGIMFDGHMRVCDTLEKICKGRILRDRYCEIFADYQRERLLKYGCVVS